jgi:hypothetical protein
VLQIARDAQLIGKSVFQYTDYEGIAKGRFRGMEAALARLEPKDMYFMQQAKNRNKADGSRGHTLPCHEWRVDETAWIEVRSGVILEREPARMERHQARICCVRIGGLRGAGGFPFRQPAA